MLFIIAFLLLLQGCGSTQTRTNKDISLGGDATQRFPFPTKEPEVYQGDFVVGNGVTEEQYFVARKGDKWRFDIRRDNALSTTQLRSDKVYSIDHTKKTYAVLPYAQEKDFDANYLNNLTWGFFRGANYIDYEEVGRGGGQIKYRAKTYKDSKAEVLITIDEATGIMVRQEITGQKDKTEQGSPANYIYEVRNLKTDVDDSVFEIPTGYRQVSR
jgi:hypothetical protein